MRPYSHSQISKYLQCPRSYKLHYLERLRGTTTFAFLAFGSAMDTALNAILLDLKNKNRVEVDYKAIFDIAWEKIEINKRVYDLKSCKLVNYAKADFAPDLLTPDDLALIYDECNEEQRKLPLGDLISTNVSPVIYYYSLRRKAHWMLDAYFRDIVPRIEEVKSIQQKISLSSNCGRSLIGYVDAVVRFKGMSEYSILDNKTSSAPYSEHKIRNSEQLSLYAFSLGINHGAYAVMIKAIKTEKEKTCSSCGFKAEKNSRHGDCYNKTDNERCHGAWIEVSYPYVQTQLLIDTISPQTQNVVIENIGEVVDAISAGVFPKNLSACSNIFGNPCPYIKYCWSNDMDNLVKIKE